MRTRRAPPLPVQGDWVETPQGLRARFSLAIHDGGLAELRFESTPCATLVAYCEALTRFEAGGALEAAPSCDVASLVTSLAGVPPDRRDRAVIAVAALRAALHVAKQPSAKELSS